jgi:cellulose synthase (UDP-forming)
MEKVAHPRARHRVKDDNMATSAVRSLVGATSPSAAPQPRVARRVTNDRIFRVRDLPLYLALSVVNVTAALWAVSFWLGHAEWSPYTVVYVLLTVSLLLGIVMFESRWLALPLMRRPRPMAARADLTVGVATTFVPGSESLDMLERTVRGLVAMDYPHETWVLDEGDDPGVRAMCARLGARHFTRKGVPTYQQAEGIYEARTKHGNYNAWLDAFGYERYEIIVGFDPDHVPEPAFLCRLLGYFDDPTVGYVQAPQFYYNQEASFIARGAAEETYAYYSSIQMCSYAIGYPIVTGCHNVHRTTALQQVGGFAPHEADDLLITIHYRGAGWKGVYVPERLAAGITPVDWPGYLKQQRRWARSVLDVKMRIFPRLGRALPLPERVFSFVHGLYYLHGLASAMTVGLLAFMLISGRTPTVLSLDTATRLGVLYLVFFICDLFRQRFFLEPERERGIHWRAGILRVAKWPHVLLALFDALRAPNRGYTITSKVRAGRKRYAAAPAHLLVVGVVGAAWLVGLALGNAQPPVLQAAAALLLALSLVVVVSELCRFPAPYEPELAERALKRS